MDQSFLPPPVAESTTAGEGTFCGMLPTGGGEVALCLQRKGRLLKKRSHERGRKTMRDS